MAQQEKEQQYSNRSDLWNSQQLFKPAHVPIPGVTIGPLVGKGGFGRVYSGTYNGDPVAVKVLLPTSRPCSCMFVKKKNPTL